MKKYSFLLLCLMALTVFMGCNSETNTESSSADVNFSISYAAKSDTKAINDVKIIITGVSNPSFNKTVQLTVSNNSASGSVTLDYGKYNFKAEMRDNGVLVYSGTSSNSDVGSGSVNIPITVTPVPISVAGVTVSPTTASLVVCGTQQLTPTVLPANATNKAVTWSSSDATKATVNANGLVTAVAAGSATITVKTVDGNKTATCAVTVTAANVPVTGVTVSPTTASLVVGTTQQLTPTVLPANAVGSATITVKTFDGNKTAICAVTVTWNKVLVEGGTFQMGSTTGESDEQPVHSVTLSSFYIGKYEVTQAEWVATMGSNPSYCTGSLKRPVEQVSWYDIMVYCNKRSIAEGLTPCYTISGFTNPASWGTVPENSNSTWNAATCNWSAKGYRMPTEAEWEFAARGGNGSNGYTYSGSNTIGDVAWYAYNNPNDKTQLVGLKAPNELGIHDMSGNVFECVWDWFVNYSSTAQTNPTGGATGGNGRVSRGGSGWAGADQCRVANRYGPSLSFDKSNMWGFRLARTY